MKRKIYLAVALGLAGWRLVNFSLPQAAESSDSHGLSVGAKAPDFKLKDQDGKERALADFQKPGKFLALVFYRSADW